MVRLQQLLTRVATNFAADLSGAWSGARLILLVAVVRFMLRLPGMCLGGLTATGAQRTTRLDVT